MVCLGAYLKLEDNMTTQNSTKIELRNYSPHFIYGTFNKKENTTKLVELAIKTGFRAIDTASIHYYSESFVGDALEKIYADSLTRDQLWLQTKFTPSLFYDLDSDSSPYIYTIIKQI